MHDIDNSAIDLNKDLLKINNGAVYWKMNLTKIWSLVNRLNKFFQVWNVTFHGIIPSISTPVCPPTLLSIGVNFKCDISESGNKKV